MGLGVHGGAAGNIRWLHNQGARLIVTDIKTKDQLKETLGKLNDLSDIEWVLGQHRDGDFIQADMVLRNPAIPRDSQYLKLARSHDIPIEMDSSLFFKYSPTENIIGVTGSKGKTTTTHILAHFLSLKFGQVVPIGVEGSSPLAALTKLRSDSLVVFELSSWRLEGLEEYKISPHTAVVTSLYSDHLNTYKSFEEYEWTKQAIVRHQRVTDRTLLNYDDVRVRAWANVIPGRVFWFSLGNKLPGPGICIDRGVITIETDSPISGRLRLFAVNALRLSSDHAVRNALPGIYLAWSNGVRPETLRMHAGNIEVLQHRLERIAVKDDVTYINDSAATIPDATIAALRSIDRRHMVLILGGSDKRLKFDELAEILPHMRIRGIVFLPGTATNLMRMEIEARYRISPRIEVASSMIEAVQIAHRLAHEHDVVLLSPGATSFGIFQHEFDRGEQFRQAVRAL